MSSLQDLSFGELPEGSVALEGLALIKFVAPNDHDVMRPEVSVLSTDQLTIWEALGMVEYAKSYLLRLLADEHTDE